jgi:hypothetical protein
VLEPLHFPTDTIASATIEGVPKMKLYVPSMRPLPSMSNHLSQRESNFRRVRNRSRRDHAERHVSSRGQTSRNSPNPRHRYGRHIFQSSAVLEYLENNSHMLTTRAVPHLKPLLAFVNSWTHERGVLFLEHIYAQCKQAHGRSGAKKLRVSCLTNAIRHCRL